MGVITDLQSAIDAEGAGKCLLWVNPAQRDPYEGNVMLKQRRVRVPINSVRFEPQRAPYLIALDLRLPADADLFRDSVKRAKEAWTADNLRASHGQPICGWVTTPDSAETVANHWGWHCYLHSHNGRTKLLRFHDPGVREWLWAILSEAQRKTLLGPAKVLFGIGRAQLLTRHASTLNGAASVVLTLNEDQWRQVSDYAIAHAALLNTEYVPFAEQAVLASLSYAAQFGVTQDSERELYALHALQLGRRFHDDVRMKAVWDRTRTGAYYGSAIEEVFACPPDELHLIWLA